MSPTPRPFPLPISGNGELMMRSNPVQSFLFMLVGILFSLAPIIVLLIAYL